jgi:hypothetical protein
MTDDRPLDETIEVLERTPGVLQALVGGALSAGWCHAREGDHTWSPVDILGHLVHGEETDWIPRAKILLGQGQAAEFEPFDRVAQFERFPDWTLPQLLERFERLREKNLQTLRGWHLSPEQLALQGRHPELGLVTMAQLLTTWGIHDLSHVAQIARAMASHHRNAVGPWSEYLPILHRR